MQLAVVGLGRIGQLHALHAQEVSKESGHCVLRAVVDVDTKRAHETALRLSETQKTPVMAFSSVAEMVAAGGVEGSIVCTPTDSHRADATALVEAGQRILLEKPLTGTLDGDREFAAWLDAHYPHAVMLAFQRRFDEPLRYAKQLLESGAIGRCFKIVSILEDSNPAPDGYVSGGILPDMSVHNVDEILWLTGKTPRSAVALGNSLYSRKLSRAVEDFDDAFLYLWFEQDLAAQISVSRNHVSGYRVETWIYGESGQIHIGRFEQRHTEVVVEAYGRRNHIEPIAFKKFVMRNYGSTLPEFVDRFGEAYKAEVTAFVEQCVMGKPFEVTHRDGVRAMEAIDAGMRALITTEQSAPVRS
jgi:myo-inositol 2-dehydrogenase/D-chiro-inositol 1-dehydrogenase